LHELRVEGLTKRFRRTLAVDALSFEVRGGELLGLLGPNGAGKTTTFLSLCGLLRPDSGTIVFDGVALGPERGRTISLIPEMPEVYPMLTVWEHLGFVARSMGLRADWERRGAELLENLDLLNQRDILGAALSKGMKQKALIAATLLAQAPVVLFDEPMTGLDPKGQRELRQLILNLRATGTAVIISTHLIEWADALCDRVLIMKSGRAVATGTISELRARGGEGRSLEDFFLSVTG
jgi:ABC-type multidrug transport system ATPase subunit